MTSFLLQQWRSATTWPAGRTLFNRVLGMVVPYAGTIRPEVISIESGRASVELDDKRRVRNHVGSVHAAALANLGELTANLAMVSLEPEGGRSIITGMDIRYLKKARGRLTATSEVADVDFSVDNEVTGLVSIRNSDGEVVCEIRPIWRVGPAPDGSPPLLPAALEGFLSRLD